MTLGKRTFENIAGNGENLETNNISLSHNVFFPSKRKFRSLGHIYCVSSVIAFNLDYSKTLSCGKELILSHTILTFHDLEK